MIKAQKLRKTQPLTFMELCKEKRVLYLIFSFFDKQTQESFSIYYKEERAKFLKQEEEALERLTSVYDSSRRDTIFLVHLLQSFKLKVRYYKNKTMILNLNDTLTMDQMDILIGNLEGLKILEIDQFSLRISKLSDKEFNLVKRLYTDVFQRVNCSTISNQVYNRWHLYSFPILEDILSKTCDCILLKNCYVGLDTIFCGENYSFSDIKFEYCTIKPFSFLECDIAILHSKASKYEPSGSTNIFQLEFKECVFPAFNCETIEENIERTFGCIQEFLSIEYLEVLSFENCIFNGKQGKQSTEDIITKICKDNLPNTLLKFDIQKKNNFKIAKTIVEGGNISDESTQ